MFKCFLAKSNEMYIFYLSFVYILLIMRRVRH